MFFQTDIYHSDQDTVSLCKAYILCEEMHCHDAIKFQNVCESVLLIGYAALQNFGQNCCSIICSSDCGFVRHYIDNNRPLRIEENGEHSLSSAETCFQDVWALLIFNTLSYISKMLNHLAIARKEAAWSQ